MVRIPKGYKELTFIQSTGTQWINVDINTFNTNIRVSLDCEITTFSGVSDYAGLMGTDFALQFAYRSDGKASTGNAVSATKVFEVGKRILVTGRTDNKTISNTSFVVDGVDTGLHRANTDTRSNYFALFSCAKTRYFARMKCYGFKAWYADTDVLARNFIPCLREIDNVVGMYDTVEGKFYANAGTGSFIAGDVVVGDKPRLLFMGNNGIRGYEFYDYIENTARQIIDTGILPKPNQDYEVRFKLNSIGSNYAVFGGRDTQTNKTATLFFLTASRSFRFDRTSQINVSSGVVPHAGDVFKFEYSNGVVTLTNETTGQTATTTMTGSYNLDGNYPIHLFSVNTTGTDSLPLNGSIYEWKLKENGELVQHLVPSKQLASNSIGMLDLVNNEFHPNVGSGVFTVGNIIPSPVDPTPKFRLLFTGSSLVPSQYEVKEYLAGDGRAYIETGIQYIQGDIIELNGKFKSMAHDNGLITMKPWNTPTNSRFMFSIADSGSTRSFTMAYNSLPGGSNNPRPQYYDTEFHTWRYEDRTLTIDDGLVSLTNTEDYKQGTGTLQLFQKFNGPSEVSIKYYNHWRNGQLIASYVAVNRKSDNVLGMYDIVTKRLLTNAGTGNFTAGQTINATNMKSRLLYIPR